MPGLHPLSVKAGDAGGRKDLLISDIQMGLIFSVFSWNYAALQIPGGWTLERIGCLPR